MCSIWTLFGRLRRTKHLRLHLQVSTSSLPVSNVTIFMTFSTAFIEKGCSYSTKFQSQIPTKMEASLACEMRNV
jgi:hypothetical protein